VSASISQTPSYRQGKGKKFVQDLVRRQVEVHKEEGVDIIIVEYFQYCEEICWCVEAVKELGMPVAATMCIGPEGDVTGVSAGDCAVAMARAGADLVGANCHYDPYVSLNTMQLMRDGLKEAGLKVHLMCQPLGFMTADLRSAKGYSELPEYPLSMETRSCNRFDFAIFARAAYELGVRYIGGCCGTESVHIRAMAEELAAERGRHPLTHQKQPKLELSGYEPIRVRSSEEYWRSLKPSSGRVALSS
jgi:betaine-homocysteine S-methyltransferase